MASARGASSAADRPSPIGLLNSRNCSAFRYGCEMFLKPLSIAVFAAILAPIIGASFFFGIHAFESVAPTDVRKSAPYQARLNSTFNQTDSDRSFAAPALRSIATQSSTLRRNADPQRTAGGLGNWLTTISCADGQPAHERGHCKPIKSNDVSKNTEMVDSKKTPKAASRPCIERKKLLIDDQILPRMALGGPCITE